MDRTPKTPNDEHPISIQATHGRVLVRAGTTLIADTTNALTLREASYPAVQYVPLADIDPQVLRRSDSASYCPFKGDASYFTLVTADGEIADAVWTYEQPYPAVTQIAGHAAFYPDRVQISVEPGS
jgi:uncharacterized protein (DUF427 family)